MLCSDGLTDMVSVQRIKQLLEQKGKASEIGRLLVDEALNNGGKDNVTVVVVKVRRYMFFAVNWKTLNILKVSSGRSTKKAVK